MFFDIKCGDGSTTTSSKTTQNGLIKELNVSGILYSSFQANEWDETVSWTRSLRVTSSSQPSDIIIT